MKSNFIDKKALKWLFLSIFLILIVGFVFNIAFMDKSSFNDEINNTNETNFNKTDNGLYNYYVMDTENSEKEIYIVKYKGNETTVIIPDTIDGVPVTKIDDSCFTLKSGIKKIIVPDTVKIIGTCAFAGCENLETIIISNSVQEINPYAFVDCEKLTIYAPENSVAIDYARENKVPVEVQNN